MSTSTVSVSANPNSPAVLALGASTRRRNVSVSEKKTSNFEIVSSEGATASGGGGGGVGVGVGIPDQHQLQQQISSDKSKDLLPSALHQINNKSPTTVYSRRTTKKPLPNPNPPEKPRWQTVLSVFTKNFLLLILLIGLVQLIRTLTLGSSGFNNKPALLSSNAISEIEARIGEFDAMLKETNKMVQLQLDVVDNKIHNQLGAAKRDLINTIEQKADFFQNRFNKLEARADGLEESLSQLKSSKLLTNQDLHKFSEELKNTRNSQGNDDPVSLDEIGAVARSIVEKAIEKHAADGLARVDYALASGGAMVVAHSEPLFPTASNWLKIKRINVVAQKMLQPSFGEPGHCFPLKGSNGFVEIKLRRDIIPDAVTLEHVAKSVAYDRSSAPKNCQIFGWFQGLDGDQSSQAAKKFLLAEFAYDLERSNAQTFNVEAPNSGIVNMIRLEFSSNHGGSHTCIYRLRVHGH